MTDGDCRFRHAVLAVLLHQRVDAARKLIEPHVDGILLPLIGIESSAVAVGLFGIGYWGCLHGLAVNQFQ